MIKHTTWKNNLYVASGHWSHELGDVYMNKYTR